MPDVVLKLHQFDSIEAAMKTADDIRNAGSVNYVDTDGGDVNVTVSDVTVENA
jgi:hypothetical protein